MRTLLLAGMAIAVAAGAAGAQPVRDQATQAGSAGVAQRLQSLGYKNVHDLRRGADGRWTGKATRHGVPSTVTVQPRGAVIAR
ncbi:MAG: hypothetical protein KIT25_13675 [Enhydrobacter sp.]|nr:MAG: hypothetical protein KIT25_13675 [Enhydrobacter sp.]